MVMLQIPSPQAGRRPLLSVVAVVSMEPILTRHALDGGAEKELGALLLFDGGLRRGAGLVFLRKGEIPS
jgi:hypothetical protein